MALSLRIALATVVAALGLGGAVWVGADACDDDRAMGMRVHVWGNGGQGGKPVPPQTPMPGMGQGEGAVMPPSAEAGPVWQMGGGRMMGGEFDEDGDAFEMGLAVALGVLGLGFAAAIIACRCCSGGCCSGTCCSGNCCSGSCCSGGRCSGGCCSGGSCSAGCCGSKESPPDAPPAT